MEIHLSGSSACVYTYTHIIYIYICICIYMYMYMYVCMYVYMCGGLGNTVRSRSVSNGVNTLQTDLCIEKSPQVNFEISTYIF